MAVKCSVIIPAYNAEKHIIKCLESILKDEETKQYLEVIVVNDGSTDNTEEVVKEYAQKNSEIKLITKQNGGVSSARNRGLEEAQGKYLYFADADDEVFPKTLRYMIEVAEKTSSQLILANTINYYVDTQKKEYIESGLPYGQRLSETFIREEIFPRYFKGENAGIASLWNKLFSRDVIVNNSIKFDEKRTHGEDWAFNIEYFKKIQSLYAIEKIIYAYYLDGTQGYGKYSKALSYSLLDGHKKIERLNEDYVGFQKSSIEYARFMGRYAEQSIQFISLKECAEKEKREFLRDKSQKKLYAYMLGLKKKTLTEAGFSRRDKLGFFLLKIGAYKLALKVMKRK